jgi:hypothetical protein
MASCDSSSFHKGELLEAIARNSMRSYEIDRIQDHSSKQETPIGPVLTPEETEVWS